MLGFENGKEEFCIPVNWMVCDNITVQADSLMEAIEYVRNNKDNIPCGTDAEYVNDSWEITGDEHYTDMDLVEYIMNYNTQQNIICIDFHYKEKSPYASSLLYDGFGNEKDIIAYGIFRHQSKNIMILLRETQLENHEKKRYEFSVNDDQRIVCEEDLSRMSREDIYDKMNELAIQYNNN